MRDSRKAESETRSVAELGLRFETDVSVFLELAAAAAAKSLQSCLTPCDPIDGSPPGSSTHGIFQARVLEWGAIAFSICKYLVIFRL